MPSLTIEASVTVLTPPIADETQRRFENEVVGNPGETYTEFTPEPQGNIDSGIRMGFRSPTERRRIEELLEEIDRFINPSTPDTTPTPNDQPPIA